METCEEFISKYIGFLVPFLPMYKDRDEIFTQFIIKHFPEFLEKMEAKLTKTGKKYFVTDHMTLADIIVFSNLMKLCYNDNYANCHILQAIVENYPKVKAWAEVMKSDMADFIKNSPPFGF